MTIVISLIILALIVRTTRLPVFETTFGIVLFTPIMAYLVGRFMPLSGPVYYVLIIMLLLSAIFLFRREDPKRTEIPRYDLASVGLFSFSFLGFYFLCLMWPDFIAIAERHRDYAVLSSVITSPIVPMEPWLAGYELNYYLYWYRFGHMLSTMLGLEVWEVYHQLQSFTFAFFLSTVFVLFRSVVGFANFSSLCLSLLVVLGSNIAGLVSFSGRLLSQGKDYVPAAFDNVANYIIEAGARAGGGAGWWGPSRVIEGAINEFPAWSFLLGDAHPHYLNLALIPFFLLLASKVSPFSMHFIKQSTLFAIFLIVPSLWLYNSNTWEFPIWLGLTAVYSFLLALWWIKNKVDSGQQLPIQGPQAFSAGSLAMLFGLAILATVSLYLSLQNISAPDAPLRFVQQPVARSTLVEIMLHWGLPLFLTTSACLILVNNWAVRFIASLFLLLGLVYAEALPLLAIIFLLNAVRVGFLFHQKNIQLNQTRILIETIGISALGLIILPEILYLDDVYGGINERMNTIFKIYSSNWFLFNFFALFLIREACLSLGLNLRPYLLYPLQVIITVPLLGFFFQTIEIRKTDTKTVAPYERGLSTLEDFYPGSAAVVRELEGPQRNVILEAQGPPYHYTSHVATLSGQIAFLGWANHVRVYLETHDEVSRREALTSHFYNDASCAEKETILVAEGIDIVVVGPLERQHYPELDIAEFECLETVFSAGEYVVFSVAGEDL